MWHMTWQLSKKDVITKIPQPFAIVFPHSPNFSVLNQALRFPKSKTLRLKKMPQSSLLGS